MSREIRNLTGLTGTGVRVDVSERSGAGCVGRWGRIVMVDALDAAPDSLREEPETLPVS